tara:strand:- start:536 stop:1327 length:792 start_codon:yes stop_codon:yes gene_type:complete
MTIGLDLCINADPEFPYTQTSIYEVRLYGRNAQTNAQKLKHIEIQFMLTQKSNYKIDEVQKTLALLDEYFSYRNRKIGRERYYWNDSFGFYDYSSRIRLFLTGIQCRLETVSKYRLLETRSIKSILGNFEESISPKMIHKILTWLKKKDFPKYGTIKRGIKEEIIIDLKKHDIIINPKFLCDFIDDNNPIEFVKEWKIKTHINGKRMKNIEIRKLFKKAFYKRENDCIRFKMIYPSLNSLPKHIESLIISYLGFGAVLGDQSI